jgi:hypothetical protein
MLRLRQHGVSSPRRRPVAARRAAMAGLLLGAALFNVTALWRLAGAHLIAIPADAVERPTATGCTSLALDRAGGQTRAWPCAEPAAWLESALAGGRLAAAARP